VRSGDIAGLPREVRDHDPALALDGGADGLNAYRVLASRFPGLIFIGGVTIFEVGEGQSDAVSALLVGVGLSHLETRPDLGGTPRIVVAMRQSARPPTRG
jgi:release factor glutamine methyltransferase